MSDDVLITVGIVISVIIIFELIVATILFIKYTKKRYGWFDFKCCCCKNSLVSIVFDTFRYAIIMLIIMFRSTHVIVVVKISFINIK
jgi:hypothetical protein